MDISPYTKQIIFCLASLLTTTNLGMMFGYPAILTQSLLNKNSDLHTDIQTASWIATIPGLSGFITVCTLGPLMHVYGRRTAHLIYSVPMLLGWILASVSYSIPMLIFARILQGMGNGGIYFCSTCIGEFTCPKLRGVMLNCKTLTVSLGIGLIHTIGFFFSWRITALFAIIPIIISMTIAFFWPESPEWLVTKKRYKEAEIAFYDIRGHSKESEDEIANIIAAAKARENKPTKSALSILKEIKSPVLWRPVLLLCCAITIPEAAGRHYIPAYSISLAKRIANDDSKGYLYTFLLDFISIVSSIISFFLVIKFTRRSLIIFCGYTSVVLLTLASIVLYIKQSVLEHQALTISCLLLFASYFAIVYSCTLAASYILLGELLPLEYRPLGTVVDGVMASLVLAVCVRIIPVLMEYIGIHGMFLVFAFIMFAVFVYMHYDLPETKDRTLHDIGDYFRGKSDKIPRKKKYEEEKFIPLDSEKRLL